MKIRTRLRVSALSSIVLAIVVGFIFYFAAQEVDEAQTRLNAIYQVVKGISQLNSITYDFILYQNVRPQKQWRLKHSSLSKLIAEAEFGTDEEDRMLEERIKESHKTTGILFDQIVKNSERLRNIRSGEEGALFQSSNNRLASQLISKTQMMVNDASLLREKNTARIARVSQRSYTIVMISVVLMIVAVVVMFLRLSSNIARSFRKLEEGTEIIAGGDLDYRVNIETKDEVGKLAQAFNEMTSRLKSSYASIDDLKRMEEELRKSRDELEMRVQERTEELGAANEELQTENEERLRIEIELRESENRLRDLSTALLSAQERERKLIAQEIHDSMGASLAAAKFKVEGALDQIGDGNPQTTGVLKGVIPILQGTIEEARRIQMSLRPSVLDDLGILATINWFCRQFQSTYSHIRIKQEIGIQEHEVPDSLKIVIYRVLQEALNNTAKHSKASVVLLYLQKAEKAIQLVIRDSGQGFDLAETQSRKGTRGLGLDSMRERTELSGGSFSIESRQGAGTVIRATWPL